MPSQFQITVNNLTEKIKERLNNGEEYRKSSAPLNHYGWSQEEHDALHEIADAYRMKGHRVSREINHGVTDWVFYPKVQVDV